MNHFFYNTLYFPMHQKIVPAMPRQIKKIVSKIVPGPIIEECMAFMKGFCSSISKNFKIFMSS